MPSSSDTDLPERHPARKYRSATSLWLIRTLVVLGCAFVLLILWGWIYSWKRLPYYTEGSAIQLTAPVMTGAEYSEVIETHPRPYIVDISLGTGRIIVYGATHTKNPHDPQITDIERRWNELKPTVALCESRLGILFPGLMDPIREFSEPGYVHQLARRDGIPTYTWEPPPQAVMDYLFRLPFSKQQLALRLKLGPYFSNLRHGKPADPAAFVNDYLNDNNRWPGLETTLTSITEIDDEWRRHFPTGPDWRDVSDEFALPGFLKEISTNEARDEHFARVLLHLIGKGERVFAIAGLSHAVKLEPALQAAVAH